MGTKNDDELAALFVAALQEDGPRSSKKKSRPPAPPDARGHTLPGPLDRAGPRRPGGLEPLPAALARAPTAMHPDDDGSEEPTPPPVQAPRRAVLSSIAPARIAVPKDEAARRSGPPPAPDDRRTGRARVSAPPEGSRASKPPTRSVPIEPKEGSRASKPPTRASGPPEGSRASKPPTRSPPSADLTREPEPSRNKPMPRGKPAAALLEEISRATSMPSELTPANLTPTGGLRGGMVRASSEVPMGPDGEPLIDHRGRAKPLYKPRRARPENKKLSRSLDLVLGAFPGARLLAHHQVSGGILYAFLGLAALVPFIAVLSSWNATRDEISALSIDPRWLGLHAGIGLFSLLAFELLRVGSSSPKGRPTLTRAFAALCLPSGLLLAWAPALGVEVHEALELAWLVALPSFVIGLTATIWCAVPIEGPRRRSFLFWETIAIVVVLSVFSVFAFQDDEVIATLASALRSSGFRLVPDALVRLAPSA